MNGKKAREIRKALKYEASREDREYHTFLVSGTDNVMQYDSTTGDVKTVYREVEKETEECVSGGRKLYKFYKKKYNNPDYEVEMNKFPTTEEIKGLTDEISKDINKSEQSENRETLPSPDKETGE